MIWQVKDMDEAVAWAKRNPMLGSSGSKSARSTRRRIWLSI